MGYATKLKHIFRIHGNFSLWHLVVFMSFSAALGGYIAPGIARGANGWRLATYYIEGSALGVTCTLVVACIDHFLFRNLYLHFHRQGRKKWCDRVAVIGLGFAFFWLFVAAALGAMISTFVVAHK